MNKRGFTLVELIATIVILGIVIGIAVPIVVRFSDAIKEKQKVNTIKEIEEVASKYAFDTNKTLIFVEELVTEGYYELNDENGKIIDPESGEILNCHIIEMKKNGNYYTAEFKDTKFENEDGSCDTNKLNIERNEIVINAYSNGNKINNTNNWIKSNNITLKASSSAIGINCNVNNCSWLSNSGFNQKNTNEVTISNVNLLKTKYTFQYSIYNDSEINRFTGTIELKIDNELPVIYNDNIYVYKENNINKVDIDASDGNGSGISGYYFAKDTGQSCGTYTNSKTFQINETGNYLICVKDSVGNEKITRMTLTVN